MRKISLYIFGAVLFMASALPVRADEVTRPITLWPILYHSSSPDRGETDVIWPFFRYERETTKTRYAVRPFIFSTESDTAKDYRTTSIIWPISIYKREGPRISYHLFPFIWYKRHPDKHYSVLFPFYWNGKGKDYSYFHLWPLFGENRQGSFVEHSTLWPFFRYGSDPAAKELEINAPWPLVQYHRKADYVSHRFLPLYWYEQGPDRTGGFVFPYFWHETPDERSRGIVPLWYFSRGSGRETDLIFPLYYRRSTPEERMRFITPLYFSRRTQESRINLFLPITFRYVSPQKRVLFVLPLYADWREDGKEIRTVLPLYYKYRYQNTDLTVGLPVYMKYRSGPYTFSTFFPLYYHSRDDERRSELTYYFPVYGSYRRGESVSQHFVFFPLYSQLYDRELDLKAWDVLWPLFHYETSSTTKSVRFLPFYWHDRTPKRDATVVFPLYWSFRFGEDSYQHIIPLYGVHRKGDAYTKRFILGPLYMDTRDAVTGLSQQDILFPLFSRKVEGDEARSWLFPFYFHRSKPDSSLTLGSLALLPPYLISSRDQDQELFHLWPFYGHLQRGAYEEHSVLWPLFRSGTDSSRDMTRTHLLLYYHEREGDRSSQFFFPLWYHRSSPDTTTDMSLFLHYYTRDRQKDETHFSFLWIIPPDLSLIRHHRQQGALKHGFFPFYTYASDPRADSLSWSLLWPIFSYSSKGEFVQQSGFLWRVIYYEQKDADTYDFRFLWRFIRKAGTATSSVFEFNPFYYTEQEEGKGSYWSVLGGLFGVETTGEQKKNYRLFWVF
jgi:hypothetical protein